ncbi:MAG: dethiobiotin synthase, partial [Sphingomonadales bacterium]
MNAFFITATGTGIGKTVLTAGLAFQLKKKGRKVMAVKPVISGFEDGDLENDTALIAASLGLPFNAENINKISPFRYLAAVSPNLAAAREGREIMPEALLDFCDKTITNYDLTLIEG